FNGVFRENLIYGGLNLQRAGDTIAIRDNLFVGVGPGITVNLVVGASQLLVDHNTVTACSGAVIVTAGTRTKIVNNNIEPAGGCAPSVNATMIDLQGSSGDPIENAEVRSNYFSGTPGTTTYQVRTDWANGTIIEGNTFGYGTGLQRGVQVTAN